MTSSAYATINIYQQERRGPYRDQEKHYNGRSSLTHDVLPLVKLLEEVCTPGKDIEAPALHLYWKTNHVLPVREATAWLLESHHKIKGSPVYTLYAPQPQSWFRPKPTPLLVQTQTNLSQSWFRPKPTSVQITFSIVCYAGSGQEHMMTSSLLRRNNDDVIMCS